MTLTKTHRLTKIALIPALMAATVGITIPLFNLPPITMQTLFVLLAGLLLSEKDALMSISIYLLLGVLGLPVFAGFKSGLGVLLGPSGGFLVGFLFAAVIISFLKRQVINSNSVLQITVILIVGTSTIYLFGALYMSYLLKLNIMIVSTYFTPYLPGDILKIIAAINMYFVLKKAELTF